jgi:hypothetical protein
MSRTLPGYSGSPASIDRPRRATMGTQTDTGEINDAR